MHISEFDYSLPKELIAQFPREKRDSARLLVIERKNKKIIHRTFPEIIEYLHLEDVLVLNDTKVIPARLWGRRKKTGGKVEIFLLERIDEFSFRVLVRARGRLETGEHIDFKNNLLSGVLFDKDKEGFRIFRFTENNDSFYEKLYMAGEIPLPPYIKRKPTQFDRERYQTVYAKKEGAVASPTAGLHFTQELLEEIKNKGINVTYLTLHINYATFNPVKEEHIEKHKMYKEYFEFPEETARIIADVRKKGRKVLAVGTTTCRVLETVAQHQQISAISPQLSAENGWTDLFI
ncbi:MAG: tRNA preQ1(34) S-adenosylmethionine ribosyltransferase-isomerase QueA, partial [Candidatus Omnitrophota bacterium]